ncbi:MAG: UDP-N-acetylmuramoyl-L-alanyl-D-glutamate--2,6-diaminopimelate ligase [Porticoccaceae bacterium]|nr:UDP-N-acetylmuramoyl-L-alanyl-D-glutamate--2,6-diaminopimelate ligase [Porticoccaceae bacterium]
MAAQKNTAVMTLRDLLPDMEMMAESVILPRTVSAESVAEIGVSGLQLDSRKVRPGDVFIAVPGFDQNKPVDGRQFIGQALAAGAVAVLAEHEAWSEQALKQDGLEQDETRQALPEYGVPVVLIAGLVSQISSIAGRFYDQPSEHMRVIGITGTNGKTTCSHLLAQLFNQLKVTAAVIGTLGYGVSDRLAPKSGGSGGDNAESQSAGGLINRDLTNRGLVNKDLISTGLTTPDAVLSQAILADMRAADVACVAMEVSSHSLDQGRISGVRVAGAVFTNLSQDHLDYHGTMAAYLAAKEKLFQMPGLEFGVINVDDPAGLALVEALDSSIKVYTYSLSADSFTAKDSAVYVSNIRYSAQGIEADVVSPWGEARIQSRLVGEFNLSNLLAVMTTACASGLAFDQVMPALSQLRPVPGRLEVINEGSGPRVVIDYAHTPDALSNTLSALRYTATSSSGASSKDSSAKLWCVFGCGGDRDKGKRPAMAAVAGELADEIVVTSDNPRNEAPENIIDDILSGANRLFHRIEDRAEAIAFAISHAEPQDTVLIAGKGHEDFQINGESRLPFSDAAQARLALRHREGGHE